MNNLRIIRLETSWTEGTFGAILVDGEILGNTLELPWKMNSPNLSCIPAGQYICTPYMSPKFGKTYQVMNVHGRTYILFHPANLVTQLEGCIAVGESIKKLRVGSTELRGVANSGKTFKRFMDLVSGSQTLKLTIKEEY